MKICLQALILVTASLSLTQAAFAQGDAAAGKGKAAACAGCHGADGKGNQALGAPNLSDDIWLYGRSPELIKTSIRSGRQGLMPAQSEQLHASKIRLLTGYVYSLAHQ